MKLAAAVLAVSTSACAMSTGAKSGSILGGVALGVTGMVMMNDSVVDADHNGVNEWPLDDNLAEKFGGFLAVAAGLALMCAGITARTVDESAPPPAPVTAMQAPVTIQTRPPGSMQLAEQIDLLVQAGHCEAAWATWQRLDAIDHAYAETIRQVELGVTCQLAAPGAQ
jgi:hypothetical protein